MTPRRAAQEPRRAIGAPAGVPDGRPKAEAPQTGAQEPTRSDAKRKLREELRKLLPGYRWTVERGSQGQQSIVAVGTISSGSNRLSTMRVTVESSAVFGGSWYLADVAGYGTRSARLARARGRTLAQAVRALQDLCAAEARSYSAAEKHIADARVATATEYSA